MDFREFVSSMMSVNSLSRMYLVAAIDRLEGIGVSLTYHSNLEGLPEANIKLRNQGWFPLVPLFDPNQSPGWPGFWLEGKSTNGETVSVQAAVVCELHEQSLATAMQNLSLFYKERPCTLEAVIGGGPLCAAIRGRVVYSGGGWAHKRYRGKGLFETLPRISRTMAHSLFSSDWTVSLTEPVLREKGVVARYGYSAVEPGLTWKSKPGEGDLALELCAMPTAELFADLAAQFTLRGTQQKVFD